MSLAGLRVLSLESRRAAETAELIRRQQGEAMVAPSMREIPLEQNREAIAFGERLLAGAFDMVILLTGVGTKFLVKALDAHFPPDEIRTTLGGLALVVRGPKPAAAVRELGLTPTLIAPEPNTWHEIVSITEGRPERRIAVQEYGRPSSELYEALRGRGAEVTPVAVYQWQLPEDLGPLQKAAQALAAREIDVVLLTSSVQVAHLLGIARDLGIEEKVLAGLRHSVVGSIGPTTSETLEELGIPVAFAPEHPKLGMLVKEAAERASALRATNQRNGS